MDTSTEKRPFRPDAAKHDDDKRNFIVRFFTVTVIILFFSGFAFFKILGDRLAESRGSITIQCSSGIAAPADASGSGAVTSGPSPGVSGQAKIPVYLTGAVKKPGIYEVNGPIYLYQLIDLAGGFADNADDEAVNLAFRITENMMIRIPVKDQKTSLSGGGYSTALIPSSWVPADTKPSETAAKININTAGIDELSTLSGIGESTAKAIMDYRAKNGLFAKTADIMKVPGIKESRYERIKDQITVG